MTEGDDMTDERKLSFRSIRGGHDPRRVGSWRELLNRRHSTEPTRAKAAVMGSRRPDVASTAGPSYRIEEVAEMLGVDECTLRDWERALPVLSSGDIRAPRREYRLFELRILFRIRELLHGSCTTLDEVRFRIDDEFGAGERQ